MGTPPMLRKPAYTCHFGALWHPAPQRREPTYTCHFGALCGPSPSGLLREPIFFLCHFGARCCLCSAIPHMRATSLRSVGIPLWCTAPPPLLCEPAYTCHFGQIRTQLRRPYLPSLWCNLQAPHPLSCTLWAPAPLLRARTYVSLWRTGHPPLLREPAYTCHFGQIRTALPRPHLHAPRCTLWIKPSAPRAHIYVSLWYTLRAPALCSASPHVRVTLMHWAPPSAPRACIYMVHSVSTRPSAARARTDVSLWCTRPPLPPSGPRDCIYVSLLANQNRAAFVLRGATLYYKVRLCTTRCDFVLQGTTLYYKL